jgi:hypothetical protein
MMTELRSLAPAGLAVRNEPAAGQDAAPPPVFPVLPFAYTAYAERFSQDVADYVDRLARADQGLGADETLGLQMLSDMNQAFFSLVWAPFGAAINRTPLRP